MTSTIPEGYELLVGRSREHALKALATADERGLPSDSVLSVHEGFLIPLAGEETSEELDEAEDQGEEDAVELPKASDKVADIEAFAKEHNIDLGDVSNNKDRIAVIETEFEKRTAGASDGVNESKKED